MQIEYKTRRYKKLQRTKRRKKTHEKYYYTTHEKYYYTTHEKYYFRYDKSYKNKRREFRSIIIQPFL